MREIDFEWVYDLVHTTLKEWVDYHTSPSYFMSIAGEPNWARADQRDIGVLTRVIETKVDPMEYGFCDACGVIYAYDHYDCDLPLREAAVEDLVDFFMDGGLPDDFLEAFHFEVAMGEYSRTQITIDAKEALEEMENAWDIDDKILALLKAVHLDHHSGTLIRDNLYDNELVEIVDRICDEGVGFLFSTSKVEEVCV